MEWNGKINIGRQPEECRTGTSDEARTTCAVLMNVIWKLWWWEDRGVSMLEASVNVLVKDILHG